MKGEKERMLDEKGEGKGDERGRREGIVDKR